MIYKKRIKIRVYPKSHTHTKGIDIYFILNPRNYLNYTLRLTCNKSERVIND